jgi:polyhydroxyalkanoate synthesis regulator phasin
MDPLQGDHALLHIATPVAQRSVERTKVSHSGKGSIMSDHDPRAVQDRIAEVKQRLAEARSRVPQHDAPHALMAEVDELEEELLQLQDLAQKAAKDRIAELQQRLQDARARIPKHTPPPALMAEIDELEEELERLRSGRPPSI